MNKKVVVMICCMLLLLPTTVFAQNKIIQSKLPISVETKPTIMFDTPEPSIIPQITINETSANSFTDYPEFTFAISHEPFDVSVQDDLIHFDAFQNRLFFSTEKEKNLTQDGVSFSCTTENGNLIIKILKSDPNTLESLTITDIPVQLNPTKNILGEHNLYVSFSASIASSQLEREMCLLKEDFVILERYSPSAKVQSLLVELEVNGKSLFVNGQKKDIRVSPYISENGYVMLPLRELTEVFPEMEIKWDNSKKTASILKTNIYNDLIAEIELDSSEAIVAGKPLKLRVPATENNGRIFLALRDVANIYGIRDSEIKWDPHDKIVVIEKDFVVYK